MLSPLPYETPDPVIARASGAAAAVTAVAGAGSRVAMASARRAAEKGLIEPVLVGDLDAVAAIARDMDWNLDGIRRVPADGERRAAETAVALARGGEAAALMLREPEHYAARIRDCVAKYGQAAAEEEEEDEETLSDDDEEEDDDDYN